MIKQNKWLFFIVFICLLVSCTSMWMCYSLTKEVEELRQQRTIATETDDIFNEALRLIDGDSVSGTQPIKKQSLADRAKSAAQAKAMNMIADKIKQSVQKSADEKGKDATVRLKAIDAVFAMFQKALDAEDGKATETDVARELFLGLKEVAKEAATNENQ